MQRSTKPPPIHKVMAVAALRCSKKLLQIILTVGISLMTFTFARAQDSDHGSAYEFSFMGIDGTLMELEQFRGRLLLVVNTASRCGFTKQYADLQKLYDTYKDRGLVILGVPSNDFGAQEPGSDEEIKQFCEVNFDINFPMTGKTVVNGAEAHPFYQWAGKQVNAFGRPRWNFHKYLISPEGKLVDWFSSMTSPSDSKITAAIERWLPKSAESAELPIAAE